VNIKGIQEEVRYHVQLRKLKMHQEENTPLEPLFSFVNLLVGTWNYLPTYNTETSSPWKRVHVLVRFLLLIYKHGIA
jgi:hypothetical protein